MVSPGRGCVGAKWLAPSLGQKRASDVASFARIERDGKVVAESVRVYLTEQPGPQRGWRGSFVLDLSSDPDAGEWVTQIKPDPQDPGCQLILDDG